MAQALTHSYSVSGNDTVRELSVSSLTLFGSSPRLCGPVVLVTSFGGEDAPDEASSWRGQLVSASQAGRRLTQKGEWRLPPVQEKMGHSAAICDEDVNNFGDSVHVVRSVPSRLRVVSR